jgi:quercetin dioxygenase-like cupin family protein
MQVRSWDFSFEDDGRDGAVPGYAHVTLLDRAAGAVHTDLGLCRLGPGAATPRHVHAYEQCAYVLRGSPVLELGDHRYQLGPGDYALFPVGLPHAWHNAEGDDAGWLELCTPQAAGPGGRPDTFAAPGGAVRSGRHVAADGPPPRPPFGDPTLRLLGHDAGTGSQADALAARGREPAGMDTALLAYSGITVKMLVDAGLGADLCTMFMVDYEPGGAAQAHDHPFEEAYVVLEGEIEAEVDGERRTLRAGEVLFCGVGVLHGFSNTGAGHVRWIETQAPQPPRRHSYRWPAHWARLRPLFPPAP